MKEQSNRKQKRFSEEFKQEAIELSNKLGNSKAALELGINESNIRNWKRKLNSNSQASIPMGAKKSYAELEKENKRLSKENGYLREINKVLKKSTAIFSADHMGGSK